MVTVASPRFSLTPYPQIHASSFFERSAARRPNHIALVNAVTGAEHTYRDTWQAASRLARRLQEDGLKKSDRVAVFAANSPEYVVAFHAILLAGGTVTTMNPLYREREVEHQLHDCDAAAFFVSSETRELGEQVWAKKERLYTLDDAWLLAGSAPGEHNQVTIDPLDDLAILPYSSGTTGGPKGVMLTHYNITSNIRQIMATGLVDGYSVLVDFLPFFHIYGMVVLMNSGLAIGSKQVIMPRFDPQVFFAMISQHKATNLFVVPPVMLALANLPEEAKVDLTTVRFILSGAAPLPVEVGRRVESRYSVEVVQGYGMTEASPVTHTTILGRDKPGTVGPPVSDTLQKVVDLQSGEELGFEEVGELLVEGPQVMKGYWNKPDATQETILFEKAGNAVRPDGAPPGSEPWHRRWLRTGDIVTMDEEGYITIHDRAKEMIKYRGYQIAPAELESVIIEHPAVADAAVIPKADPETGEVPKAFVVVREGQTLSVEEISAFVAERVAPYKKLREVEFIAGIPKNPSGKILRRELIEQERAKVAAQT
jgi:acyl-CoA synthetase (AMP-forming)/AMP-acid ligase II